ncbi:hypothetical protein NYG95_07305 [Campylobacter felis]|uniref:Uncharacterized protein n=1 Tax=Campylobacter felis TaxID=2974565 RepID=A0ABT7I5A8_9BACT|nr:hypothetical protein [Campylobacter upsaliensis]MDL0104101.1 hypothetical protein [Campylobacter felis]MDL0108886.1 hypothetical protein [Campylobacter felis]MDL0147416.1 hypothetical protein [Campylobacter felis]
MNFYSGEVLFTRYGNIKIAKVGIQRKGGDSGEEGAKMLQFKIDLTLVESIYYLKFNIITKFFFFRRVCLNFL